MQLCMPGIVSLVLIWLYRKKQITGRWLLLLLVCTAGTFVLILTEWSRDGKEQVTELPRNLSADAPETVALEVEL